MNRYYFDIHDGISVQDGDGLDLPDLDAARVRAMRVAAAYAGNITMLSSQGGAIFVEVLDASRIKVLTVRLAFGVDIH